MIENSQPTRLLIVDDHIILREGLVSLLGPQPDFEVVGEAGSVQEAVLIAQKLEPDLVLMDYGLPDGTGTEATEAILSKKPDTKIVFLTIHDEDDELFAAIRSGAKGYLLKNVPVSKMLDALRGLACGEAPISREMTSRILEEFAKSENGYQDGTALSQLTPRERDVLREISTGASNREIAERLFISVNTVKVHVHNLLEKLELRDRRELAEYAAQHRLNK